MNIKQARKNQEEERPVYFGEDEVVIAEVCGGLCRVNVYRGIPNYWVRVSALTTCPASLYGTGLPQSIPTSE